jgi:hypothetical protein
MSLLDALLGLSVGGIDPITAAKRDIIKPQNRKIPLPSNRPTVDLTSDAPRVQPVHGDPVAATQPDVVQPQNGPIVPPVQQPVVPPIQPDRVQPTTPAEDAIKTSSLDPAQLPDAYKTPPDLSQMYLDYMQSTQRQNMFNSGATLIAAGLAQDQNKQKLIDLASSEQTAGATGQGDMFKTMFELQTKAADEARKQAMRTQLPAIAKAHGLSLQDVQVMFEGGTLDAFISDAAKPNTVITERADGSKVLIDQKTGDVIREISPAKPRGTEYQDVGGGKKVLVYSDDKSPVDPNEKLPSSISDTKIEYKEDGTGGYYALDSQGNRVRDKDIPSNQVDWVDDPSGAGGKVAVKKGTNIRIDNGQPITSIKAPAKIEHQPDGRGGFVAFDSQGKRIPDQDVPGPDKISLHELSDGTIQPFNDNTGKPMGQPYGPKKDESTADRKNWVAARAAAAARGDTFPDFDQWLKELEKKRDPKATSANVDPKTGIQYDPPPPDMTYKHNPDGSFVIDPNTNTPVAVAMPGTKLAGEQTAAEEKKAGQAESKKKSIGVATGMIDKATKILEEDSWTTPITGAMGALASIKPGSRSADFQEALNPIKAIVAFDNLATMRANSPTGGALGNVSNEELNLLASTLGSFNTNQSHESLKENLELIRGLMNDDPLLGDKNPAKLALEKWRNKYNPEGTGADQPAAAQPPPGAKKYRWDPVKKQRVEIQ